MASNGGRCGPEYDALRQWVIAHYDTCYVCTKPVDKTLDGRHRLGPTLEHIEPISRGGSLLDKSNAALSHRRCNMKRGANPDLPEAGPSRDWLKI